MIVIQEVSAVGVHTSLKSPHWCIARQSLYFMDIYDSYIFRYDYREDKFYQAKIKGSRIY